MLRRANINLYLHVKWLFLECFQTAVLQQAEYSVILLTDKGVRLIVSSSSGARHRTYSIKVEKPSEPAGTFEIHLLSVFYFLQREEFFLKIFKNNQMEVASNMKVFIYTTLILKRPQRRNTHSAHKHN